MNFTSTPPTEADAIRFWSNVNKTDTCWNWMGSLRNKKRGYGQFWYRGKMHLAHRISYLWHFGELPDDKLVCHKCDNRSCVRPDHFFLGTDADNMIDKSKKGRAYKPSAGRTHCKNGHELTEDNVRLVVDKQYGCIKKVCKSCKLDALRRFYERRKNAIHQ